MMATGKGGVAMRHCSGLFKQFWRLAVYALLTAFVLDNMIHVAWGQITHAPPPPPRVIDLSKGTGPTLYTSGDLMLKNPVEGCAVFVTVSLVATLIETMVDKLRTVRSRYFQTLLDSMMQEVLIVGLLTLMLIFIITLGQLRLKWTILLNYAVLALMFMVVFFIVIVCLCAAYLQYQMKVFRGFEGRRMDADPVLSPREQVYKYCRDRFRESLSVTEFRSRAEEIVFSDYVFKMQRFVMPKLCDLSWRCWGILGVIIVINGVRARIAVGNPESFVTLTRLERTVNVASYVLLIGYMPLLVYVMLHWQLGSRLQECVEQPCVTVDEHSKEVKVRRTSDLLFFGSLETTTYTFQAIFVILEWYLAIFVLGMGRETWSEFGYAALGIFAVAIGPVVLFMLAFPWTVITITMLSSLGEDLNVEEVRDLLAHTDETTAATSRTAAGRKITGGGPLKALTRLVDETEEASMSLHATAADPTLDESEPLAIPKAVVLSSAYNINDELGGDAEMVEGSSRGIRSGVPGFSMRRDAQPLFRPHSTRNIDNAMNKDQSFRQPPVQMQNASSGPGGGAGSSLHSVSSSQQLLSRRQSQQQLGDTMTPLRRTISDATSAMSGTGGNSPQLGATGASYTLPQALQRTESGASFTAAMQRQGSMRSSPSFRGRGGGEGSMINDPYALPELPAARSPLANGGQQYIVKTGGGKRLSIVSEDEFGAL